MYKAVAESVDDVLKDVRYGGYLERDARRARRLASIGRKPKIVRPPKVDANPECVSSPLLTLLVKSHVVV